MGINIGCARVSTEAQDLTAQRNELAKLDVAPERIYVDHGLTGTNRAAPRSSRRTRGLSRRRHARRHQARPPRAFLPDARDIVDELGPLEQQPDLLSAARDAPPVPDAYAAATCGERRLTLSVVSRRFVVGTPRQWLYRQPQLRTRIEGLRAKPPTPVPARQRSSDESLRQRLTAALEDNQRLRTENRQLRIELAGAYGTRRAEARRNGSSQAASAST